jgi:hypothetical protein
MKIVAVAVAAWPWQRLHCPRSISAFDYSGFGSHGRRRKTHMTFTRSVEGLHICLASIAGQVAHKSKPGHSRHFISCSRSVRFWLWRDGVSSPFISLMWYLWFSLGISLFVDRRLGGGVHFITGSLCPVYLFSGWFSGTSLLSAAHLACLRLGRMDREKSQVVSRLSQHSYSDVGQDQASFL